MKSISTFSKAVLALSVSFLSVSVLSGCAHRELNERLDERVKNETVVKTPADLSAEAAQVFGAIPGLTADQKQKLLDVHNNVKNSMASIRDQSLKLRSLLIKDLASPNYDSAEVDLIKGRLKSLEHQRLTALFDAIDQVNTVMGRNMQADARQSVMRRFMESQSGAR